MTAATKPTPRHPLLEHKTAATVGDLERKATTAQPSAGDIVSIDASQGLVTAIVSVTGIEDHVKDVIHPGSYADTLTKRRPKVVQHHDWQQAVARVEDVAELPPGDARLPKQTKDGSPWPPGAGALLATMRYNLKSTAGRDAFESVRFYSETDECEWSIGYRVPTGKSSRGKDGVRQIKAIDLYEISFVLFGAAPLTGTLSVKSDTPAERVDEDAITDDVFAVGGAVEVDWDALDREADRLSGLVEEGADGPFTAAADAEEPKVVDTEPAEGHEEVVEPATEPDPGGHEGEEPAAVGEGDEGKGIDDLPWFDSGIKRVFTPERRRGLAKQGSALPDGSYPIENETDLRNAVRAIGRAEPVNREKVRRHIVKRARALGKTDILPPSWLSGKTGLDAKMTHESLDRSPRKNWVEIAGQLPAYIQHIAKDLHEKRGMPLNEAIPTAIAAVKRWAAGAGGVKPDTRAKAAKAVAEWEALRAKSHARSAARSAASAAKSAEYDPAIEVGPDAGHRPPPEVVESALYPHLPGTFEETKDLLHRALSTRVFSAPNSKSVFLTIDGTWEDRVVATWFPPGEDAVSYEFGYDIDADGKVWLAEPEQVTLTASVGDDGADGGDLLPHPAMIDQITDGLKTSLLHESKAGRVLSAVNAKRLRGAVEQLVAVLEAAGMPIGEEEEPVVDTEPLTVPDSTAPSARTESGMDGKVLVDPKLYAGALRILADKR